VNVQTLYAAAVGGQSVSFPDRKTRDAICSLNLTFQGLTVQTRQYGSLPWFEAALVCLDADDRQAVYAAKRAAGDSHCLVECFSDQRSIYDEGGQPYQQMHAQIWEQTPAEFLALVEEVMLAGFVPVVIFDGDEGDLPLPAHGHANALRQLPILVDLLRSSHYRDLNGDVLYARFWDGIFYGSSPDNIAAFGRAFRALLPDGHLALEHSSGHIPCGEGGDDFQPGGRMSTYDVVVSEIDFANDIPPNDTIWQIAGRLLGPAYKRPPDQPVSDDPHPPFYLAPGNPRGRYFTCCMEWEGAYHWVRGQSTADQEASRRAYIRALGYTCTG
jgi:hypothetical protein